MAGGKGLGMQPVTPYEHFLQQVIFTNHNTTDGKAPHVHFRLKLYSEWLQLYTQWWP